MKYIEIDNTLVNLSLVEIIIKETVGIKIIYCDNYQIFFNDPDGIIYKRLKHYTLGAESLKEVRRGK